MDAFALLKLRLKFVTQLHAKACAPFQLTKAQIENEEPPYEPAPSEDGEPPFLAEWIEADESLQMLGYACVSMLATSLNLYFKTWESELHHAAHPRYKSHFKKGGWLHGYRQYFIDLLNIDYADSPISLMRLEEIVRARNAIHHPRSIESNTVYFTDNDLAVLPEPLFSSELDRQMSNTFSKDRSWFLPLALHVSPEKFDSAMSDVIRFAAWLDERIYDAVGWNQPNNRAEFDA